MALIKWRDSYSVDFEQLDKQHEMLVKFINEMFIIVRDKEETISLSYQIDKLIKYTQEHFDFEEKLLEKAGCEFLEQHKEIHKNLVNQVVELKNEIENHTDGIVSDLYSFLRNWLIDHILKEDMKYKDCLSTASEKGLL